MPEYTPKTQLPGFTLPPARPLKSQAAPEQEPKLIVKEFRSFEFTFFQPVYRTLQQRINFGTRLAIRKSRNTLLGQRCRLSAEFYYAHDLNTATDKPENNLQDTSLYFRMTAFLF